MYQLAAIIITAILINLFWRQLVTIAGWAAFLFVLYALLRVAPALGITREWLATLYGATIVGFLMGGALAMRPIINMLVNLDRRRGHDRVDGDADKRLV